MSDWIKAVVESLIIHPPAAHKDSPDWSRTRLKLPMM